MGPATLLKTHVGLYLMFISYLEPINNPFNFSKDFFSFYRYVANRVNRLNHVLTGVSL